MESKLRLDILSRVKKYQKKDYGKYFILMAAFLLNGQVFGHNYASSFLYSELLNVHSVEKEIHISLVGSITFGLVSFCGIFMVFLMKYMAERWIFLLGLTLFSCGPIISAFVSDLRIWYFTYSLPRGLGGSILYLLSFSTAAKAFPNNVCTAATVVSLGASVFSIITPLMVQNLLKYGGLFNFLLIDGLYMLLFLVFTPIYKSKLSKESHIEIVCNEKLDQSVLSLTGRPDVPCADKTLDDIIHPNLVLKKNNWLRVLAEKKFILFLVISFVFLSFYNLPYVHLYNYLTKLSSHPLHDPIYVTILLGVGATLSKSLAAVLVEVRKMSSTFLLQISLLMFGLGLTFFGLLTYVDSDSHFYTVLLFTGAFTLGIGEGCIWSLIYPVCYSCAHPYTDPSIFCIYSTIISLPCSLGAPLASFIYSNMGSYPLAFFIGGAAYLLAGNMFWLLDFVGNKRLNLANQSNELQV